MKTLLYALSALTFLAAVPSCAKDKPDTLVTVKEDDPEMKAAIEKAVSTVDQFIDALQKPMPDYKGFSVKLPIKDGDKVEHFWLSDVKVTKTGFDGKIDNQPGVVTTVKYGDRVSVKKNEISDWMYLKGKKLVGGTTIRVLSEKMPPDQRKKFEGNLPFELK